MQRKSAKKSDSVLFNMHHISITRGIGAFDRHMLSYEKKNHVHPLRHFHLYYNNMALSAEMAPRQDERLENMSGGEKKNYQRQAEGD